MKFRRDLVLIGSWWALAPWLLWLPLSQGEEPSPPPAASPSRSEADARLAEAKRLNEEVKQLYAQGRYREAMPKAIRAVALRKEVLGDRHPDTVESLNNLAEVLQAQGNYAAAKPLYEQALAIHKAVLGERHPATATSLNNLAELLQAQGDYAAAKPLYEQVLSIRKEIFGDAIPTLHKA